VMDNLTLLNAAALRDPSRLPQSEKFLIMGLTKFRS
jgi:hypothetical protein